MTLVLTTDDQRFMNNAALRLSHLFIDPDINEDDMVDLVFTDDPDGLLDAGLPRPESGQYLGELAQRLRESQGTTIEPQGMGSSNYPRRAKYSKQQIPKIEGSLYYARNRAIEPYLRKKGTRSPGVYRWGYETNPDTWPLLVIHQDVYEEGIYRCHLYYEVAVNPVDLESGFDGVTVLPFLAISLGDCEMGTGKEHCVEWLINSEGQQVDDDGEPLP